MIRSTILLLLGLAIAAALRHRPAALRHLVLAASLAAAVLMPAAERISPRWHLGLLPARTPAVSISETRSDLAGNQWPGPAPSASTAAAATRRPVNTASLVWAAGSLVSLMLLLAGVCRMLLIVRRAKPVSSGPWTEAAHLLARQSGMTSVPTLCQTSHSALLFTWGLHRPRVLLPRDATTWSQNRIETVLAHELAHVQRGDWAVQLLAEIARCLYWFNPVLWVVCRRLRLESELAADAAVLRLGVAGPDYAAHLVELARLFRQTRWFLPAPAMARASDLERRVRFMLNARLNLSSVTRSTGVLVLAAMMALALPVASVSLDAASSLASPASVRPGPAAGVAPDASPAPSAATPPSTSPRRSTNAAAARRAQAPPVLFSGMLVDQQGRAVPLVPLTLSGLSGTPKIETTTDTTGQFTFAETPAGVYRLAARKPGFQADCGAVNLVAGKTVRQDVVLQLGTLTETLDVSYGQGSQAASVPVARHTGLAPLADTCAQSEVGGCVTPPVLVTTAAPVYPANHLAAGHSGSVVIRGRILADGGVADLEPEPGADGDFAKVAMQAIRLWQFSPTRLGGTPVAIRFAVTVNFQITTR